MRSIAIEKMFVGLGVHPAVSIDETATVLPAFAKSRWLLFPVAQKLFIHP